jgi:hypothetical protein
VPVDQLVGNILTMNLNCPWVCCYKLFGSGFAFGGCTLFDGWLVII